MSTTAYEPSNVFAKILRGELPAEKVYETDRVLAFMDIMPRSEGHVLVIPKTAARNLFDIAPEDLAELAKATQVVARAAKAGMAAEGLTIQQFNESAGGQVVFHIHVHVLPRWAGVALRPPGNMGDPEAIARNAERIRAAIDRS
jgi:histidine triad (HIT) family protein